MRKLLLLSSYLCFFFGLQAQIWDGDAGDNNWNNPLNWDTDMVPLNDALVEFTTTVTVNAGASSTLTTIPAQIIVRGTGTILTLDLNMTIGGTMDNVPAVQINPNAHLRIPTGRELTLTPGASQNGIVNFSGAGNAALTIEELASLNIIIANRGMSLQNNSFLFTNNGTLLITECVGDGINLGAGATFINNGDVTLGILGQDGIDNKGSLLNNGSIQVIRAAKNAILNDFNATFTNKGLLDISDIGLTTDDGIFSRGDFTNDTTGVITITNMQDEGIDALDGTFTNIGIIDIMVRNAAPVTASGISVGSGSVTGNFVNRGIIDINAGGGMDARAVHVFSGVGGATSFVNNGLLTLNNGNPNQLFFTQGTTVNGPTGTINTGNGRINVNLWNFTNNGLIESNYPTLPGVFTGLTGNSFNDGFFRTNNSLFSNGTGVIVDNGINMNDPAQTTFDLGGGCDVTIGGAGAQQIWLNMAGDSVAMGPDLSFENAFSNIMSTTITAFGIDVSLTVENLCAAALPIELTSFTATPKEKSVMLNWETAGEINNDYMAVERSGNAREFTEIGKIAGAGNSNSPLQYQLEDTAPLKGINYYRLRQVDYDGTINYSNIISVNFNATPGIPTVALYPNVVRTGGSMEIDLVNFPSQQMTFRILNSQGQIINNVSLVGGTRQSFEPGNLPAGIYFLINTNSATKTSTKFVLTD